MKQFSSQSILHVENKLVMAGKLRLYNITSFMFG